MNLLYLKNSKERNPVSVVVGGILLQMCIGAIYTWSLFNGPIMDKFGFQKNEIVLTYSIAITVFAFTTIFSGKLQDKIGPRKVATIGAVLYGIGVMLTSLATNLLGFYLFYGVVAGIGVGFAYVCPISTCIKWYPNKKGTITGIAVGAFGIGSLVFKFLIEYFIHTKGVSKTFFYIGFIYLIIALIGASLLALPSKEYVKNENKLNSKKEDNFTLKEMIKTKSFYIIWIMFFFASISGLFVIGMAKDIALSLALLSDHLAASAVSVASIFNATGRLSWGVLSDKIGRIEALKRIFIISFLSMLCLSIITLNSITFFILLSLIAFSFGGFLVVFPALTGDFFGSKNLGGNYGLVYQSYGLAALAGPIISALIGDLNKTFLFAAFLSLIGFILTFVLTKFKRNTI